MSEYISRYDFREQIEGVRKVQPNPTLFRQTFFRGPEFYSATENIEWDEIREGAPMAKYIHPRIPAAPTERQGFKTTELTTPFIQEARIITGDNLLRRQFNENIYQLVSPAERAQQLRNGDFAHCLNAIDNRIEQQCWQMMLEGRVEIRNEEGTVDAFVEFEGARPPITLTGGNRWGQVGVSTHDTLIEMFNHLADDDYISRIAIMGEGAYRCIQNDPDILKKMDLLRAQFGEIRPEPQLSPTSLIYKLALLDPAIEIYVYRAKYTDPITKLSRRILPDNMVLMYAPEATENRMMFGAVTIIDDNNQWVRVEGRYVPERRIIKDPPTERLQVTSRPLPTPRYNASWQVAYVY